MGDWSILKQSNNDYLANITSSYASHHDTDLSQFHIMSSFIERTFSPASLYNENSFCTPDNIEQCISHLNQELAGLGLKPLSREGVNCTTTLINSLNDVIRLYQRSGRVKEDLEDRLHRVSSDVTENQTVIRRLKQDRERLEREIAQEKEQHRQIQNKHKNLAAKIKIDKDELKRMQAVVRDRDAQYKHELKKKQREINKLMERLHQLLMDKNPDRRIGMDMVGIVQRDGKRSTWKNTAKSSKQEEMYQLLISNYEEKQQELRVENSDLRECLVDMQKELSSILNNTEMSLSNTTVIKNGDLSASSSETDLSTASTVSHELSEEYYQMPYDVMKENLHKNFRDTCKKIKDILRKSDHSPCKGSSRKPSPSKSPSSHQDGRESERRNEEVEKLRKQIDKYKDIVKQQEELIQQSLQTQSKSMENSFFQESQLLQERESLSEQRRRFYQEKANFEEERRKFTEAAIQLGKEKKQLEQERTSLLKSQFLQMSPYTSTKPPTPTKSSSSLKGEKTRLLPSTPVFSPAPGGKVKAPTTDELYRVLGITPKQSGKKERLSSGKRSLPESFSNDSLSSSSKSAPCDLTQQSAGPAKQLSFDDIDNLESTLFENHRRRSSTGSKTNLDGQ